MLEIGWIIKKQRSKAFERRGIKEKNKSPPLLI
jgi:hypothetical protein